jgi:hypothetical protein
MAWAALPEEKRAKESLNIAVELAPSLLRPALSVSVHSSKIRFTFCEVQFRLPAIQSSYSWSVSAPEPRPDRKNWMPKPSLLPSATHLVPVFSMIVAQSLTKSLHVAGGLSGSRPGTRDQQVARFTIMRDALRATGRPIVYSINPNSFHAITGDKYDWARSPDCGAPQRTCSTSGRTATPTATRWVSATSWT